MVCNRKAILNPFTGNLQLIAEGVTSGGQAAVNPTSVLAKAIASAVPVTTKTTVVTLTASQDTYVTEIICSGMEYGKWYLVVNSVDQSIKRGGSDRDVTWTFVNPLKITSGQVLDIKVEHFVTGQTPDFESTIVGYV